MGGLSINGVDSGGGSGSRSLGYQGPTDGATTSGNGGGNNMVNKQGYVNNGTGAPYQSEVGFRKPSRLEALPGVGTRSEKNRKKSGPTILNTMGTF